MNNKRFKMTPTPTTTPNLPTKKLPATPTKTPPTTPKLNEIDEMIFSALAGKPTPTPTITTNCNPPPGGWPPGTCPPPGCEAIDSDGDGFLNCSWECNALIGCRDTGIVFEGAYSTLADCINSGCKPCTQYDPQPCGGSCLWMWFGNCEGNAWSIVTDNCSSTRSHCEPICSCAYPTFIGLYTGDTATTSCLLFGGV